MTDDQLLREFIAEVLVCRRTAVSEVIKKSGKGYALYTKHKKGGKRRKLGTHKSKASAERQERAIHAHEGAVREAWFSKKAPEQSLVDKLADYAGVSKEDAQEILDDFKARGIDPDDLIIDDADGFDKLAAAAATAGDTRGKRTVAAKERAWFSEVARLFGYKPADLDLMLRAYTNYRQQARKAMAGGITPEQFVQGDRYGDPVHSGFEAAIDYIKKHPEKAGSQAVSS